MSEEEKTPLSINSNDVEMDLGDSRAKNARKAFYMGDQALSKFVWEPKNIQKEAFFFYPFPFSTVLVHSILYYSLSCTFLFS